MKRGPLHIAFAICYRSSIDGVSLYHQEVCYYTTVTVTTAFFH